MTPVHVQTCVYVWVFPTLVGRVKTRPAHILSNWLSQHSASDENILQMQCQLYFIWVVVYRWFYWTYCTRLSCKTLRIVLIRFIDLNKRFTKKSYMSISVLLSIKRFPMSRQPYCYKVRLNLSY